jgi:hypothetical protein
MRAILINPYDRSVTEVETSGSTEGQPGAPSIYDAMSVPQHRVELFTVIELEAAGGGLYPTLYLDDEGLLAPGRALWRLKGYPSALAGCGLILGSDPESGDTIPCPITLDDARALAHWTDLETTGDVGPGREGVVEGPDGKPWPAWIGGQGIPQPAGTEAAKRERQTGRDASGEDAAS